MARTFTLSDLRTRVRERADMENSDFISDAELNRYINASWTALFDKLVKADPERFMREQTITGDGSTTDWAVSSDYMGTYFVKYRESSDQYWCEVPRVTALEAVSIDDNTADDPLGWHPVYNNTTPTTPMIRVLPPLRSNDTCTHVYLVEPITLDTDDDTINGVSGWEEYIIIDAAIKCLNKEESNTGALERELARMDARLDEMIENRTMHAGHVVDSRSYNDFLDDASSWFRNRP